MNWKNVSYKKSLGDNIYREEVNKKNKDFHFIYIKIIEKKNWNEFIYEKFCIALNWLDEKRNVWTPSPLTKVVYICWMCVYL